MSATVVDKADANGDLLVASDTPKRASKAMPKWEIDAKERIRAALRRMAKPLTELQERNANEGDTRLLVTDFLCDALGYDKYTDLTTEYQVKGEFADYGVRIDGDLIAFIEVKRIATKLAPQHLRQVEMYAVNEGVEWVMLTNGVQWQVYHVGGGLPVELDLAIDVTLAGDDIHQHRVDQLFFISREALKRKQINQLWKARRATSPKSLAQALLSPAVVVMLQKELRRQTGHAVDVGELAQLLKTTLLRAEAFEDPSPTATKRGR